MSLNAIMPFFAPSHAEVIPQRNVSTWTRNEKIGRVLWALVSATLFKLSFHNWYGFRARLLKIFGAKLGNNVRIRRTVKIEIPWNLKLGDDVSIGDGVILYALGPISIGERSFVSQWAHLCAGSHDYTRSDYPLQRLPIHIGKDCWIAADSFVGPDLTIGDRTVIGARAGVFADLPSDVIAGGSPAKPIKAHVWAIGAAPEGTPEHLIVENAQNTRVPFEAAHAAPLSIPRRGNRTADRTGDRTGDRALISH